MVHRVNGARSHSVTSVYHLDSRCAWSQPHFEPGALILPLYCFDAGCPSVESNQIFKAAVFHLLQQSADDILFEVRRVPVRGQGGRVLVLLDNH